MRITLCFGLLLLFLPACLSGNRISADDSADGGLLAPETPGPEVVDHYVDRRMSEDGVTPAEQLSDAEILRRTMLDLAGRIPTIAELQQYEASPAPDKRAELVDRLLNSPDFVFHQANELQTLLEYPDRRNDGDFRNYLRWAAEQNRPWNEMFRDMLVGDEVDEHRKGALQFLKARVRELDDITNDTAILFFGVNVSCAKCHDHPLVEDWKQDHFYGMQSFFSRTFLTKKNVLAEQVYGEVKFTTTKGVEKQAQFMFLSGDTVDDRTPELSDEDRKKFDAIVKKLRNEDGAELPPPPEFSPRSQLVDVALREQDFFARNIANRLWHRMFGRGLVHPPDQLHTNNPATHPDLMAWLARDLVSHGYDLKRVIRAIALSQTYSRSSRWLSSDEPPGPEYFAVAIPRPLSPRQYGASLTVAVRNPAHWQQWLDKPVEDWKREREGIENAGNGWAGQFEIPGESFQVAVDEALLLSNSDRVQNDLLRDSGDRLLGEMKQLESNEAAIELACQAICSRKPDAEETAAIAEYLQNRQEDRTDALRQVVWALLTGPEIRFNH